jgi:hypothetical protein
LSFPFNPLDKIHLGESIRDALLRQPVLPMPPEERFPGAGIYALYYTGGFAAYKPLAVRNRDDRFEMPIYVGEAVPEGARKGGVIETDKPTHKLWSRLRDHAKSIAQVENLRIQDFHFRYLVVDHIWIPLGEELMIRTFAPVWNKVIDGFGIHTPGANRPQTISAWDTIHPGRPFVKKVNLRTNPKSQEQWIKEVRSYLALPRETQLSRPTVETGDEE